MSWTREQVALLLEEYKKWPNLYRVKSANYKNRNKRREALDSIHNALKSLKQDVTIPDIQTKFQALKQNAHRERKKCLESHRSGASADEILEPSLWYYKLIEFIFDDDEPRAAVDSLQSVAREVEEEEQQMLDEDSIGEIYSALVSQDGVLIVDEASQATPALVSPSPPASGSPSTPSSGVAGPSWFYPGADTPSVSGRDAGSKNKKRKVAAQTSHDPVIDKFAESLNAISVSLKQSQPPSLSLQQQGLSSASRNFADYIAAKLEKITDDDLRDEAEEQIVTILNKALKKCRELQKK